MDSRIVNIVSCSSCNQSLAEPPIVEQIENPLVATTCTHLYHLQCLKDVIDIAPPGAVKCVFPRCDQEIQPDTHYFVKGNMKQITMIDEFRNTPSFLVSRIKELEEENQELRKTNTSQEIEIQRINNKAKQSIQKIIDLKAITKTVEFSTPAPKLEEIKHDSPLSEENNRTDDDGEMLEMNFTPSYECMSDEDKKSTNSKIAKEDIQELSPIKQRTKDKSPITKKANSTIIKIRQSSNDRKQLSPKKKSPERKKLITPPRSKSPTKSTITRIRPTSPVYKRPYVKPNYSSYRYSTRIPRTPLGYNRRHELRKQDYERRNSKRYESLMIYPSSKCYPKPGQFAAIKTIKHLRNSITIDTYAEKRAQTVYLPINYTLFRKELENFSYPLMNRAPKEVYNNIRPIKDHLFLRSFSMTVGNGGSETIFLIQNHFMIGDGAIQQIVHTAVKADPSYVDAMKFNDFIQPNISVDQLERNIDKHLLKSTRGIIMSVGHKDLMDGTCEEKLKSQYLRLINTLERKGAETIVILPPILLKEFKDQGSKLRDWLQRTAHERQETVTYVRQAESILDRSTPIEKGENEAPTMIQHIILELILGLIPFLTE
ncbi:unnamed protein product [Allacma fusca]|uniref:RING-type domain-containing protein n=1 Tax=Allacma fusca TaxID=39272 RepID=A0A8J2JH63_9HEXA|nr:unnamed protein product [Allacma fusca]